MLIGSSYPIVKVSNHFTPDFFIIKDWKNAQATAEPEWHSIFYINDGFNEPYFVCHETVFKRLFDKQTPMRPL